MASQIITSEDLGRLICEAVGLDPNRVARIILDIPAVSAVVLYVQMWGSSELLDIEWGEALKGVKVIRLSDSE